MLAAVRACRLPILLLAAASLAAPAWAQNAPSPTPVPAPVRPKVIAQSSAETNPAIADWSRGGRQAPPQAGQTDQTEQPLPQTAPTRTASPQEIAYRRLANNANANTISIISGNPNGSYLTIAYDISVVIDGPGQQRVLPIIGKGATQNALDILFLRGVDLGIVSSNTVSHIEATQKAIPDPAGKLVYLTRLFNEEIHIYANADIKSLKDLDGKKVNVSDAGSGSQLAAQQIFALAGIKPEEVTMGQSDGIEAMRRGEIVATVLEAGKPSVVFSKLEKPDGFHFLPIEYATGMEDKFYPTELTHEDYPALIPAGQTIETVATAAVLVGYNWPVDSDRYQRLATFTTTFFDHIAEFRKAPRHPKWKEVNLSAEVPQMKRFPPAQKWLDARTSNAAAKAAPKVEKTVIAPTPQPVSAEERLKAEFNGFLSSAQKASTDETERQKLFDDFVEWRRSQAPDRGDAAKKDQPQ